MSKITGKGVGLSGSFWNMLGSGMMAANTVFLTMLVGHLFDMTVIGQFTLALTTSQIIYSIALFGANDRHMTDYQHRFRFNQYFWLRIASLAVSGIICLLSIWLLGKTGDSAVYIILLTCFMMINAFAEIYQSMFFQENRLDLSGKAIFFRYLLSTAAFAMVVIWRHSVTLACIAMILVDLAATWFWDLRFSGTFRDSGYVLERDGFSDLIRETFPLCLSLLSWQFIVNCPKYLIDMWLSTEEDPYWIYQLYHPGGSCLRVFPRRASSGLFLWAEPGRVPDRTDAVHSFRSHSGRQPAAVLPAGHSSQTEICSAVLPERRDPPGDLRMETDPSYAAERRVDRLFRGAVTCVCRVFNHHHQSLRAF